MSCNSEKPDEKVAVVGTEKSEPARKQENVEEPATPATEAKDTESARLGSEPEAPKVGVDDATHEDLMPEEEEVTSGDWKLPQVNVKVVQTSTGEEEEECVWTHRAKLYRWQDREWKERGIGDAKLLKDKKTEKIRFLLRQEKTCKIMANHYVLPVDQMCQLTDCAGSDKIWVWSVLDCSEEPPAPEQFALRFGQADMASAFKIEFDKVGAANKKLFDDGKFK